MSGASAAFRAGVSRATHLDYYRVFSSEEGREVPVAGHVASTAAMEAEGLGKHLALLEGALARLLTVSDSDQGGSDARTAFLLSLPNHTRRLATADDEDGDTSDHFEDECQEHLTKRLLRAIGHARPFSSEQLFFGDSTSFFTALRAAFQACESGKVDRCIVGGVDSLIEPDVLDRAAESGRLKGGESSVGFIPGEAAVLLEVASLDTARSMGRPIEALLWPSHVEEERRLVDATDLSQGEALANAVAHALRSKGRLDLGLVLGNLNGEPCRSHDWGTALTRLKRRFDCLSIVRDMIPATSFGDVGCAAAPLAIGIATQALRRNYSGGDDVLVWCIGEGPSRAATLVSRPDDG